MSAEEERLIRACGMGAEALKSVIKHNGGRGQWPNLQVIVDEMHDAIRASEKTDLASVSPTPAIRELVKLLESEQ